jgi:hypothetical protein
MLLGRLRYVLLSSTIDNTQCTLTVSYGSLLALCCAPMRERSPKCPLCRSEFSVNEIRFDEPFRCPVCQRFLRVPRWYNMLAALKALCISAIIAYIFGARGSNLLLFTVVAWLPAGFLQLFWVRHFSPPPMVTSTAPTPSGTLDL